MRFAEKPEFRRGRGGEDVVAGFLARRGCHYIPSYAYTGTDGDKAPRLHGLWTGYVVPDFDAAREGTRFWVEVKTKTNPVLWRRTGELRHGISVRHLADYREVERITGTPCWLFIYELSTGWLLGRTLDGAWRLQSWYRSRRADGLLAAC